MTTFPNAIEMLDRQLLFLINGAHTPFLDQAMWLLTKVLPWLGLLVSVIVLIWLGYRKKSWKVLLVVVLSLSLSDLISSSIIKPLVKRPRPTHNIEIRDRVRCHVYPDGREYRGGPYSFVSSHAANSTTLAIMLFFFLKKYCKRKYLLAIVLTLFVFVFCYTRVYLGVHYPSDIVCGCLLAVALCIPIKAYIKRHPDFYTDNLITTYIYIF